VLQCVAVCCSVSSESLGTLIEHVGVWAVFFFSYTKSVRLLVRVCKISCKKPDSKICAKKQKGKQNFLFASLVYNDVCLCTMMCVCQNDLREIKQCARKQLFLRECGVYVFSR